MAEKQVFRLFRRWPIGRGCSFVACFDRRGQRPAANAETWASSATLAGSQFGVRQEEERAVDFHAHRRSHEDVRAFTARARFARAGNLRNRRGR